METMHKILRDPPPPLRQSRPDIDESLVRILSRCLAKKPENRFQTASDLAFSLEELTQYSDSSNSSPIFASLRAGMRWIQTRRGIALAAGALFLAALVGASVLGRAALRPREERLAPELSIRGGGFSGGELRMTQLTSTGNLHSGGMVSPDLKFLAFVGQSGELRNIRLRHIATETEIDVTPPSSVFYMFLLCFSADGDNIYYYQRDSPQSRFELRRVPILGGTPTTIIETANPLLGFDLSTDDTRIVFVSQDIGPTRFSVVTGNSDGSGAREIAQFDASEGVPVVSWLPDGSGLGGFLASWDGQRGQSSLIRIDSVTGEIEGLGDTQIPLSWGSFAWTLDATAFIGATAEGQLAHVTFPGGRVTPLTSGAARYGGARRVNRRTMLTARMDTQTNLWLSELERNDSLQKLTMGVNTSDGQFGLDWPHESSIFYSSRTASGNLAVWVMDPATSRSRQLTRPPDGLDHTAVTGSSDGRTIVFIESARKGKKTRLLRMSSDGSAIVPLVEDQNVSSPFFAPGDRWIIYTAEQKTGAPRAWKISVDGQQRVDLLSDRSCHARDVSRDGRFLACCDESVESVVAIDGGDSLWTGDLEHLTSNLSWQPNSESLTYVGWNRDAWTIRSQSLDSKTPVELLTARDPITNYAWSPTGERLVVSTRVKIRDLYLVTFPEEL